MNKDQIIALENRQLNAIKKGDINTFNICKVLALRHLANIIGMFEYNPFETGEKPYNISVIKQCLIRLHIKGLPKYFYSANSILLDYYYPKWRDLVDSSVLGIITERDNISVRNWRKYVLKRDKNKCTQCGSVKNLQAHHIANWAEFPELRIDHSNGVTLCGDCHHKEHSNMGLGMFKKQKYA